MSYDRDYEIWLDREPETDEEKKHSGGEHRAFQGWAKGGNFVQACIRFFRNRGSLQYFDRQSVTYWNIPVVQDGDR